MRIQDVVLFCFGLEGFRVKTGDVMVEKGGDGGHGHLYTSYL